MTAPAIANKATQLLKREENSLLFSLLGSKCVTMATTVAQLYYGDDARWTFRSTGVLCFVRDANARSFFLRFYDLEQRQLVFQQEIYRGMQYNCQYAFFHQVEADDRVVGFNFVDNSVGQDEAHELAAALKVKVDKMTPLAGAAVKQEMVQLPLSVPAQQQQQQQSGGTLKKAPSGGSKSVSKASKAKEVKGSSRIRREDIGAPINFRHVQHVGYDNLEGGNIQRVNVMDDPVLKLLFGQIGMDFEKTVQSKRGQKQVEAFISAQGGLEKVRQMAMEGGYAPAPGVQQQQQHEPPPLLNFSPVPPFVARGLTPPTHIVRPVSLQPNLQQRAAAAAAAGSSSASTTACAAAAVAAPAPAMPPDLKQLTEAELRHMEAWHRDALEHRIEHLQRITALLDAAVLQMGQYSQLMARLGPPPLLLPPPPAASAVEPGAAAAAAAAALAATAGGTSNSNRRHRQCQGRENSARLPHAFGTLPRRSGSI